MFAINAFCAQIAFAEPTSITVGFKEVESVRFAQKFASASSALRDKQHRTGIVIIYYGSNEETRDEIRRGASSARDENGRVIAVRGLVVVPSEESLFEIYGGGQPVTARIHPSADLVKKAVEEVQIAIVETDFFTLD